MPATAEITDKYDRDDIAYFVGARYEAGETRGNFEPLFDGRDDGVYVTRAEGLLQRNEERQKEHEHLWIREKNHQYVYL